jgi:hypothetical protein
MWGRFEAGVKLAATSIAERRLGIADVTLIKTVDADTLERQRRLDQTRRRGNFNLHRQLGPALEDWYRTLATLDPSRVIGDFPPQVPPAIERERFDVALFQRWMAALARGR